MTRKNMKTDLLWGSPTGIGAAAEWLDSAALAATGAFTPDFVRLAAPSTIAAADQPAETPIAVGASYQGEVNHVGDTDVFTVTLVAGQTYMISLRGGASGQITDPLLSVTNALGVEVAGDDDGGTGLNSMISYTPTATGTYKIVAGAFDNGQADLGTYTLDLFQMGTDSVPGDFTSNVALTVGQTRLGFIETMGDRKSVV